MKKQLIYAFMALASFGMTSCGSDDDNSGSSIQQVIGNMISIAGSTPQQGTMPKATQTLEGITQSMTANATGNGTDIEITSPVALSKFLIAISGTDGYLECPAQPVATRASNQTFKYIITILVKPGVTQNVSVEINAETANGEIVKVLSQKLEVKNEESEVGNATSLEGTWEFSGEQRNYGITLTKSTFSYFGDIENIKGSYKLEDGMLYMIQNDTVSNKYKPTLLGDNNVLIMHHFSTMQDENGNMTEISEIDDFEFYVRKGAKAKCDIKDAQGTWIWHLRGDESIVRSALIIKDNTFDLIIPVWGERYTGTVTYENYYLNFKVNKFQTRPKEEYQDYNYDNLFKGWGDPETTSTFGTSFNRPFIVDGNGAYSNLANLPLYYIKK